MLRCSEMGLSDNALENMTMGMVYDLLTEKGNDQHQYPTIATPEDIKNFWK